MKDEIKEILDKCTPFLFGDEVDKLTNYITNLQEENEKLQKLCDKYEEEHSTTFNEWKETITDKYQTLKDLQEEKDKYKNVIDKIKEYCNKQIEIAKENITNSEQWLKVEECHLSAKQDIHTEKLIKKENEKILELLKEVE